MNPQPTVLPERESYLWGGAVLACAILIALGSANPFAGSWNDGSRLATVEALVDYHTWAIDQSVFVHPDAVAPGAPAPYPATDYPLMQHGTLDKIFINGYYYSDKSPVPSLWLAALYAGFKACTGWTFRTHATIVCWLLTVATSGLAYVVAVWSMYRLGRPLRLPQRWRLLLTAGFGLATIALPYARHVNNHILLLGVLTALMVEIAWLANGAAAGWFRMLRLGLLAGLSYTIDVGTGPLLLGGAAVWLAYRCRRPAPLALFALAAAPWVALHHALNYAVGGTLGPANANPAYFDWPGSPFNAHTMTGAWSHSSVLSCILYSLDLLVGKQGFLGHNLALWLAIPACWRLCRRPAPDRPELLLAASWCVGTWLLYSVTSTNHSGVCCSIRWFVPLLAPAFYILAVWLRDCPSACRRDFCILSAWGLALGALMWWAGPWTAHLIPRFWAIQTAALASWLVSAYLRWREAATEVKPMEQPMQRRAA
jgi:hypothetical protein